MKKFIAIAWIVLLVPALVLFSITHWRWLIAHNQTVLGIADVLLIIGAVFPFSAWLVSKREVKEEKERLGLQNEVRTSIFQAIAGLAVFVGVFVAWQQTQSDRSQSQATNALASQEQVAQAYTDAVNELGSNQKDVRIGGMYALEEIFKAGQNPNKVPTNPIIVRIRPAVFAVLTAYIETRSVWSRAIPICNKSAIKPLSERAADIQDALYILGQRGYGGKGEPNLLLEHANLDGAVFGGSFDDTDFNHSDLANADFYYTSLGDIDFTDADLCGANLSTATLYGEDHFEGAIADGETKFPKGFNRRIHGIIFVR